MIDPNLPRHRDVLREPGCRQRRARLPDSAAVPRPPARGEARRSPSLLPTPSPAGSPEAVGCPLPGGSGRRSPRRSSRKRRPPGAPVRPCPRRRSPLWPNRRGSRPLPVDEHEAKRAVRLDNLAHRRGTVCVQDGPTERDQGMQIDLSLRCPLGRHRHLSAAAAPGGRQQPYPPQPAPESVKRPCASLEPAPSPPTTTAAPSTGLPAERTTPWMTPLAPSTMSWRKASPGARMRLSAECESA